MISSRDCQNSQTQTGRLLAQQFLKLFPIKEIEKRRDYFYNEAKIFSQYRNDFSKYCVYVHRGIYKEARHTKFICNKLNEIEKGFIDRLIVCLPPRHSKSMTISETFPSYFLGKNPDRRIILVSYGAELARKFGRANRNKIREFGKELFDIELAEDNATITNWGIEGYRGGMISTGIGGTISGEGADLLIIDDPIKNRQEANSITYREMVWNEWQSTLSTRLQPGARVIIILTRWHEDDIVGRLLSFDKDNWDIVKLPAIAEENDLLDRQIGEPLWPEFGFDIDKLNEVKKTSGSQVWISLYQQRPSPPEGGVIKRAWLKFYNKLPESFDDIIQSWDMTFKDTKASKSGDVDYVVGQVWGKIGADKYLLDQIRDRFNFPETIRAVINLTNKWPKAYKKLIEDKANGPAVIAVLNKDISGLIPVEPYGSKEARMHAVEPDFESGNIYLPNPEQAKWVFDYIEELVTFPNGKYDDQCDSTSQAIFYLRQIQRPRARML